MYPPSPQQSSMNFYPSPFPSSQQSSLFHEQQKQLLQQYQEAMMNRSSFINPLWSMSNPSAAINYRHFMGNHYHPHRQQQYNRRNMNFQHSSFNFPPLPSISSASMFNPAAASMMMPSTTTTNSPPSPFTLSSNGSAKEETTREVFFRVLSESLKEANKFFCGKTTSWKNPFLYKTTLCVNYSNRSYCRFGVNCWYAHGNHELRCIPESEELPEPAFIKQYLSFLGLPSSTLEQIIHRAYCVASLYNSEAASKKTSSDVSPYGSTSSTSPSPVNNRDFSAAVAPPSTGPTVTDTISTPKQNEFYSSMASNSGWKDIESAINGVFDDGINGNIDGSPFGKSYHLFGNSFNLQKPW